MKIKNKTMNLKNIKIKNKTMNLKRQKMNLKRQKMKIKNKTMNLKNIKIKNKKSLYNFVFIEKYIAGLKLLGHEVKYIKNNNANLNNSFCKVLKNEIFLLNLYIKQISSPSPSPSPSPNSTSRKILLLLKKKEIRKISESVKKFSLNIIPEKIFLNKKGFLKLVIHLAQSKKKSDKREIIKKKEYEILSQITWV
jgi:SsrA-binding protein